MIRRKEPPYSGSTVPPSATRMKIETMLYEAGAEAVRWTSTQAGDATVEFVMETELSGVRKKFLCRVKSPTIMRTEGRGRHQVHTRDNVGEMRMLLWYLKALIEAAQYGMMKVEEVLFSHIVHNLPGGGTATAAEAAGEILTRGKALPGFDTAQPALPGGPSAKDPQVMTEEEARRFREGRGA